MLYERGAGIFNLAAHAPVARAPAWGLSISASATASEGDYCRSLMLALRMASAGPTSLRHGSSRGGTTQMISRSQVPFRSR